jgi:hypothetical protein
MKLFIQKSIKNEKAEKRGKSGNFPQKAEEVATLVKMKSQCIEDLSNIFALWQFYNQIL